MSYFPCLSWRGLTPSNIVYWIYSLFLALSRNFLWIVKSVIASGLLVGSFWRHAPTNSSNSGLNWPSGRVGGGEFRITSKTFIAVWDEFGASPNANSIAVMPSDQISALKSYPSVYSATSGAIQHGDPTNVCFLVPSFTCALTPKSLI